MIGVFAYRHLHTGLPPAIDAARREISRRTGLAGGGLGKLTGSVTQFASQIGLTKEACYRALRDLSDQGFLIKTGRGRYAPTPLNEDCLP